MPQSAAMARASASAAEAAGGRPLPQQRRVLVQGAREHRPGAEPPVHAGGRAVMTIRCRGVTAQRGQAGQVEVGRARAQNRPGGDRSAAGVRGQGLVEPRRVAGRAQDDAALGELDQRPDEQHVRAQAFEPGGRRVRPDARGPARRRRGRPRSGPGPRRAPPIGATVPPGHAAPAPSTARGGGQAGVQPDGEQLAPVDRAGVGQAGGLRGLEGLPGELGRGSEVTGERGQGRAPRQSDQPDGRWRSDSASRSRSGRTRWAAGPSPSSSRWVRRRTRPSSSVSGSRARWAAKTISSAAASASAGSWSTPQDVMTGG